MHDPTDQIAASQHRTPLWFVAFAWLVPAGVLGQFLSAGLGLFLDPTLLGLHGAVGFSLSLPAIGVAAGAFMVPHLRRLAPWAATVMLLYLVQVGLAAGGAALPMALHPLNAALLLTASLMLAARVQQRRPGAVEAGARR